MRRHVMIINVAAPVQSFFFFFFFFFSKPILIFFPLVSGYIILHVMKKRIALVTAKIPQTSRDYYHKNYVGIT